MKVLKIFRELLEEHSYTMGDVDKIFHDKIKGLGKKKYVIEKDPLGVKVFKRAVGRFVTLRQSDYPLKMFVLQEIYSDNKETEPEVRIGYYIVSQRMLKNKGKLSLQWGQFNPNFPKEDLKELINRARKKGIL